MFSPAFQQKMIQDKSRIYWNIFYMKSIWALAPTTRFILANAFLHINNKIKSELK